MKIKYIQKTTLIDYPDEIACTIFLFGCNFRCGFCYNPELVIKEKTPDLNEKSVLDFLKKRENQLSAVCFTGGEPLISLKTNFLEEIRKLGYKIKIDTNGSFPEKLKEIISKKLVDYISMDVKTTKEDYEKIVRTKVDIKKIEESMKIISCLENYEFRTTVIERLHDKEKVLEIVKWIYSVIGKKIKNYCLQGFTNKGKFIDNSFLKEKNTGEIFLNELKELIEREKICDKIIIRK